MVDESCDGCDERSNGDGWCDVTRDEEHGYIEVYEVTG